MASIDNDPLARDETTPQPPPLAKKKNPSSKSSKGETSKVIGLGLTEGQSGSKPQNPGNALGSYCSVKLNHENYLLWKSMVMHVIRGSRLEGFLNGTKECPLKFITKENSEDEEVELNSSYENWIAQDQNLLGWLYNSIDVDVTSEVMGNESLQDLWNAIETLFWNRGQSQSSRMSNNANQNHGGNHYHEGNNYREGGVNLQGCATMQIKTMEEIVTMKGTITEVKAYPEVEEEDLAVEIDLFIKCGKICHIVAYCHFRFNETYDKVTGVVLLQGKLIDGLYCLDFPVATNHHQTGSPQSTPQTFVCNVESLNFPQAESMNSSSLFSSKEAWHRRLDIRDLAILQVRFCLKS
ncbi:hypothetical protein EZV62_024867 [Acer yangbiense]|uniref:Retrotransposon Copia-like N-terminal domain-containing protein n=1 Tax=Acer yangbiense TaxID=1000413 RepID=A0A5C7GXF1_9ROSI|nr:hypothetical protein EZV62_024867 [Acer yangbiense]